MIYINKLQLQATIQAVGEEAAETKGARPSTQRSLTFCLDTEIFSA